MITEQRIGDYDIESILGRGSIGKVYLARHRRLGRRVALKTVHYDPNVEDNLDDVEFYKRLQREAELCAAMQHPNIVTLYEAGYEGDRVTYLASEYVEGETLLARLKRTRPLPLDVALSIASDLLRALVYAHAKGVIHRDIKPANILLTPEGMAKITDFGIARPIDSSLTVTGSLLGTPNYMSPEQVKSTPVTPRSDLFSAGAVTYEMLTGVKPFAAPELSGILYNVVNLEPPPANAVNPGIPDGVARIVARLLAKSPADRYASAGEALQDLDRERAAADSLPVADEYGTVGPKPSEDATTPLPTVRDVFVPAAPEEVTSTRQPEHTGTRPSLLRRAVPAPIFWSVTGALLVALLFSGAAITSRHAPPPEVTIPRETQQELVAKRRALEAARAFSGSGQYDEAVRRYDSYLARYPNSPAARAERDEARRLLAESQRAEEKVTVTAKRRRPPAGEVAEVKDAAEPPKQQPGRWERFKRWWRGPEQPKKP